STRDGHRRPRIFLRKKRARGRNPGSEEGGAAGAGTALGQAGQAAEAALVPPRAALAGRDLSHHEYLETPLLDGASYLQRRSWISALRRLVRDYQESIFHRSLSTASEGP